MSQPGLAPGDTGLRREEGGLRLARAVTVAEIDVEGLQAVTKDISITGLRLATTGEIPLGRSVCLSLQFGPDDFPIRFQGECRWCRRPEDGPYEVGLDLSRSSPRSLEVLERYLEEFS